MTEDTNGLSREQVEALRRPCECGHEPDQHGALTGCWLCAEDDERDPWCQRSFLELLWERLAPMLDEARAEVDGRIRKAILQPHVRDSTEQGPDFCRTCSEAIQDWVTWPCAATEPARAEVVRDVEAALDLVLGEMNAVAMLTIQSALARHMPSAVREGGTERLPASRDSENGPPEFERPSGGRTGPRALRPVFASKVEGMDVVALEDLDDPTCGEALGDMRCQLRRGHAGGHEDWRGVAQERRG